LHLSSLLISSRSSRSSPSMKLACGWLLFYLLSVSWAAKFPLTRFHKHPELHDPSLPSSALNDAIARAEFDQAAEEQQRTLTRRHTGAELTRPAHGKVSMMEISSRQRQRQRAGGDPESYFYDAANPPAFITPPWAAPSRQTGPILPATGAYPDQKIFNANAIDNMVLGFIPPQPVFPMDQGLEESDTREGSNNFDYSSLTPSVYPRDETDDNEHGVYGVPVYLEKEGRLRHAKRKHNGHARHSGGHQQQHQHQHQHQHGRKHQQHIQQQQHQHQQQQQHEKVQSSHRHRHRLHTRAKNHDRAHTYDSSAYQPYSSSSSVSRRSRSRSHDPYRTRSE